MTRKETIREFIDKRSYGAFIRFEFDVNKVSTTIFKEYSCISVEDFIVEYGKRSRYILDDYVVVDTKESQLSCDQGQTIWMTVQKKSDYIKTLKPKELSVFKVDSIINSLEKIKTLINEANNKSAIEEIDYIIRRLED